MKPAKVNFHRRWRLVTTLQLINYFPLCMRDLYENLQTPLDAQTNLAV